MELLYLSDINHLKDVLVNQQDLLKCSIPITGDMVVAYELERLNVTYIDESDFLSPDDIESNIETAYTLCEAWWNEDPASTDYEEFTAVSLFKSELAMPFRAFLNARTVYSRLFDKFPVKKISGYFMPPVGISRNWPVCGFFSVTEAIFSYIAQQRNISIVKLRLPLKLEDNPPRPISSTFDYRPSLKVHHNGRDSEKIVLVYEQYMPRSEHTKVVNLINSIPGMRAISITSGMFEMALQFKSRKSITKPYIDNFWHKLIESVNSYRGDYPEFFGNKHLLFQFECIKEDMRVASEYGDSFLPFLDVLKPSAIIFAADSFAIERTMVGLSRKKNIFTVGLLHGGTGHKISFKEIVGDVDYVLVWNDLQLHSLIESGIDKSRLKKIGCLRYDDEYFKYSSESEKSFSKIKSSSKNYLGLIQDKPLIVFLATAVNVGLGEFAANSRMHRSALNQFISLVKSRLDLQFIIKAHPSYDYHKLYRQFVGLNLPNLIFNEGAKLSDILNAADLCIMINYSTTAGLEAILNFVPTVFFNNAIYSTDYYIDHLSSSGIYCVSTIEELEHQINCILTDPGKRKDSLTNADKVLKLLLGENNTSAVDQLDEFIVSLLGRKSNSHIDGLKNAESMRHFLYSNEEGDLLIRNELTMKHEPLDLMFLLTYLAGVYSLDTYCLARIFTICNIKNNADKSSTWDSIRWDLLRIYITASFNNPQSGRGVFKRIGFILNYVIYPHRFCIESTAFKRMVVKYLAQQIFGHKSKLIFRFFYKVKSS